VSQLLGRGGELPAVAKFFVELGEEGRMLGGYFAGQAPGG
jgi:hypothetical protein